MTRDEATTMLADAIRHSGLARAEIARRARCSEYTVHSAEKYGAVPSLHLAARVLRACGWRLVIEEEEDK